MSGININKTLADRANTHGDFIEGSITFNKLMDAINEKRSNLAGVQYYALTMIAGKMVRILNGNAHEIDHYRDIIGYATLGGRLDIPDEPLSQQPLVDCLPVIDVKYGRATTNQRDK